MASVCVLYTGGTIGCEGDPLSPMACGAFTGLVESMPGLSGGGVAQYQGLTYAIRCVDPPLDSCDMTPSNWVQIARLIVLNYAKYDGFVVLHGTDTLAFTASALSFMLPGLSKPVVLTGSQLPLNHTLSDALANLTGAIVMAGTAPVPEVCVYFGSQLLRGNRSAKVNANQFAAFGSPNYPPLGMVGTITSIHTDLALPPPPSSTSLSVGANLRALQDTLESLAAAVTAFGVVVLALYPGITAGTVKGVLGEAAPGVPVKGMVIKAYGAGHGPSSTLGPVLRQAADDGVVLVYTTQVPAGWVHGSAYATGLPAIGAGDMTAEASLAKLVWLLGTGALAGMSHDRVIAAVETPLAGEISPTSPAAAR
jgi:L-asparaginase